MNKELATQLAEQYNLPLPESAVRILRHTPRGKRELVKIFRSRHERNVQQTIKDLLKSGWTIEEIEAVFDFSIPYHQTTSEFLWEIGFGPKPPHLSMKNQHRPVTSEEKKRKRRRKRGLP